MPRFDATADHYDQFRALPAGVPDRLRQAVRDTLSRPTGAFLEVGAGTGRLGSAFVAAGDDYTGADPSRPMLDRFAARFAGRGRLAPRLVQADGLALPFAAGSFDAVLLVAVVGGVAAWRGLLAESRRILRVGGSLVIGRTLRPSEGVDARMKARLAEILSDMGIDARRPGAGRDDVGDWLSTAAARHERRVVARWEARRSPRAFLDRHPTGARFAALPGPTRDAALGRLTDWSRSEFGSLDEEVVEDHEFELDTFTFGATG